MRYRLLAGRAEASEECEGDPDRRVCELAVGNEGPDLVFGERGGDEVGLGRIELLLAWTEVGRKEDVEPLLPDAVSRHVFLEVNDLFD